MYQKKFETLKSITENVKFYPRLESSLKYLMEEEENGKLKVVYSDPKS